MRKRSTFWVSWKDWAVAVALGAIVLLLAALALAAWGRWRHERDVARAMESPPAAGPEARRAISPGQAARSGAPRSSGNRPADAGSAR